MSDAPERIWSSEWKAARRGKHTMGGYTNSPIYPGSAEYVRADLHASAIARAEAALAAAEEALLFYADKAAWTQPPVRVLEGEFGPAYENEASQMRRDIGKLARSALTKIAALKGGAEWQDLA